MVTIYIYIPYIYICNETNKQTRGNTDLSQIQAIETVTKETESDQLSEWMHEWKVLVTKQKLLVAMGNKHLSNKKKKNLVAMEY